MDEIGGWNPQSETAGVKKSRVAILDDGSGVQSMANSEADGGRSVKARAEKLDSARRATEPATAK
jgi:hypothetical protein